jgi:hypothetical protein
MSCLQAQDEVIEAHKDWCPWRTLACAKEWSMAPLDCRKRLDSYKQSINLQIPKQVIELVESFSKDFPLARRTLGDTSGNLKMESILAVFGWELAEDSVLCQVCCQTINLSQNEPSRLPRRKRSRPPQILQEPVESHLKRSRSDEPLFVSGKIFAPVLVFPGSSLSMDIQDDQNPSLSDQKAVSFEEARAEARFEKLFLSRNLSRKKIVLHSDLTR